MAAAGTLLAGCAARPARSVCNPRDLSGCEVERVDFSGLESGEAEDVVGRLATRPTAHVLKGALAHVPLLSLIDDATVEYGYFDRFVLERDLARVERYYQSQGFFDARVTAAQTWRLPSGHVAVRIEVIEGPPTTLESVRVEWKDWSAGAATIRVTKEILDARNELSEGERFNEEAYQRTKHRMTSALHDAGYAYGSVEGKIVADQAKRIAAITFTIELGPPCVFGQVRFVGLGELPEGPLRTALDIHPGDPYSDSALSSAEYALAELGVLGSIRILAHPSPVGSPRTASIPVTVEVAPTKLGEVRLGAGAEFGSQLEAHGVAGWQHRNVLGGLRRLSIDARPGVVFYPTTIENFSSTPPTKFLPELSAGAEFKQPGALEARTNAIVSGSFHLFRAQKSTLHVANENILGYREYVGRSGLDRLFFRSRGYAGQFITLLVADPFSYNRNAPPPGYERIVIPALETNLWYDSLRLPAGKRRSAPARGFYVGTGLQFAGGPLGGDADDIRVKPEVRGFVPLSRSVTLATRFMTGLLFPRNYADTLSPGGDDLASTRRDDAAVDRDLQLVYFRGFLSGGPQSNRGYPPHAVGPYGAVLVSNPGETPPRYQLRPTGGPTLWEGSIEARIALTESLRFATFVDGSDVTLGIANYRINHPHLSAGVGVRYDTPVGPIRFDAGYRLPCLQIIEPSGCGRLPSAENPVDLSKPRIRDEGPVPTLLGIPMSISLAIGEAF